MFAGHQFLEWINWLTLEDHFSQRLGHVSIALYIIFAQALLPAIAPWAFWLIEPSRKHRTFLVAFLMLGSALSLLALWKLSGVPIVARIRGNGIEYDDTLTNYWWFGALYVISTCGPPFFSSYPWLVLFGAINLIALVIAILFEAAFLTSVWCLFASIASILVYFHFRRIRSLGVHHDPRAAPAAS